MPKFLFPTVISRHDARLSSTTHCALRASRIIYNLTNLSRCYSFLLSIWTYAAPCRTAHFPSNSFQCSLVILQALSLTLCQNHQASWFPSDSPGSLSLSLAKVTKPLTQLNHKSHMQRNCSTTSHAAQPLILILLSLTTFVRNSIAYAHDCQKLPHTMLSTEIFHPFNAL